MGPRVHGMAEVGWGSPGSLPAQAGPPGVAQDHLLGGFWVSPRMETPHQPWATCASAQAPSAKAFPDVQRELPVFSFVPTAPGPVTGHHWTFLSGL